MQVVLEYLNGNKKINSAIAAELLGVEVKTASRLLSKAEKLEILKGDGKTKNKVYSKLNLGFTGRMKICKINNVKRL